MNRNKHEEHPKLTREEAYVEAGVVLLQLGRWLQKHYTPAVHEGSQFEEDAIIARLLPGDTGLYVDIGASHSSECSNTWRLYQKGWRGLLIEPLPDAWGELLLNRREDYLCPMAASNIGGFANLRLCRSVSTLRPDWNVGETETVPVRTATLKDILLMYPETDWSQTRLCSIDVEGHEKEVLEGIDWETFHPEMFILEYRAYDAVDYGEDISAAWKGILKGNGYKLHFTNKLNQIWIRK